MVGPSNEDLWFYASIGRLCVAWGSIEAALDALIDNVHRFGGSDIGGKRPRNLKDKVSYVRRVTLHGAALSGHADVDWLREMVEDLLAQVTFRHEIIHGVLVERSGDSHRAVVARIEHSEERLRSRCIEVTTHDILRAATKADETAHKLFQWSNGLREEILRIASADRTSAV